MANPFKKGDIAEKGVLDNLIDGGKKALVVLNDLLKATIELGKQQKKNIEQLKKAPKTIKNRKELTKAVKKADETAKGINKTREASNKIEKQLLATEIKLIASKTKRAKQTAVLNLETKKNNDLNKEAAILGQKNLGTLERISVQNKKLIRERSKLNIDTKKGALRLREINLQLDKNNKRIKENVSNLEKQKINVGNYGASLKEAAGASGLFGGILGKLAAVQGVVSALFKKSVPLSLADAAAKEAQTAATAQLTVAQRASNIATRAGAVSLKILNKVLKASLIGVIALALGSLFAVFTRNQDRVDQLSDQMPRLGALVDVLVDRLSLIGEGLIQIFNGLGDEIEKAKIKIQIFFLELSQFDAFGTTINDNTEEIAKLNNELDGLVGVSAGIDTLARAFEGLGDELERDNEAASILNRLTREATREAKLFEAQQAAGLTLAKEQNLISRDKLKSDQVRLTALKEANKIEIALAIRQVEIQDQLLASSLDALNANKDQLELQPEHLKFIEAIKDGSISTADAIQQAADFTLSSAAGEQALNDIIDRIVEQEQARQSLLDKQATTVKKISALEQSIANKKSTELVREAGANRELAKDQEKSIEDRIKLLEIAAQQEIESFKVKSDVNIINERETAAARLKIETKLQADIKKLQEVKIDPRIAAAEKKRLATLEALRQEDLEGQIEAQERILENEKLTAEQQIKIIEEIFRLRKLAIQQAAEFALEQEGITAEESTLIAAKLENDLETLENEKVNAVKDANESILENDEETAKKRLESAKQLGQAVSKEFTDIIKARNKENLELIDAEIKRAEASVLRQEEIASKGQENILGQEQARLEKANLEKQREAERAAKQEQAIALATGFLNNLAARQKNAKNKEESNAAFALALRDTLGAKLIAEGLASFYDGTEDTGTTANPLDNKGGRKVIVHDNERIMTGKQNKRMGGISNEDAADIIHNYQHGNLDLSPSHFKQLEVGRMVQPNNSMQPMISQLKEQTDRLEKAFKDGQVRYNVHWNSQGEAIEQIERKKVKKRITHRKRL